MNFDDFFLLGHVIKKHGLAGEVMIFLDVTDPQYYKDVRTLYFEEFGQPVPYFVQSVKIRADKAIVKLDGFNSLDQLDEFKGKSVYLPLKELPKLSKGEYYLHQLVGLNVLSKETLIGTVQYIYEAGLQNLIAVDSDGKEILIPVNDEIIKKIDFEKAEITVDLPDGLLDIYES
ncbi:MAG: ribosome maturation factor RimM [Bacteroidetes bacterium]|nr:ribosome maturation factor RimM [Bacteroidota bacterium]MDA1120706.1 ribosome maturation factor RimM [Bacteroidota bacterium]